LKTSVAQTTLREALTTKQLKIEIWVQEAGAGKKSAQFKLDKEVNTGVLNSFFCASIEGDSLNCGYVLGVTWKSASR
jgi:DNA mismatch repair protein MSH2